MVSATWIDGDMARRRVRDLERERDELRTEVEELKRALALVSKAGRADNEENERLRAALEEVASYGHWSDCPAGVSDKYRCRCGYGDVRETLGNAKNG